MSNTNTTTPTAWTPELWKSFLHYVIENQDFITEDLVRQFLAKHDRDYDTEAAKVKAMTDAEILHMIRT